MKKYYYSFIMWLPFIVYFGLGVAALEVLEGDKIRDSWHVGINDFGVLLMIFFGATIGLVVYPFTFLLASILLEKFLNNSIVTYVIYTSLGIFIGWALFNYLYNSSTVNEYALNQTTSFIVFASVGLLFAITEKTVKQNIRFR